MNQPNNKAAETAKKPDFERCLGRLEEVVKRLENADLSLDEAMKLFEEGVKLSRDCQKQLEEAEGRVEILLKKADGKIVADPFRGGRRILLNRASPSKLTEAILNSPSHNARRSFSKRIALKSKLVSPGCCHPKIPSRIPFIRPCVTACLRAVNGSARFSAWNPRASLSGPSGPRDCPWHARWNSSTPIR